jgi:hypothetical protein
VVGGEVDWERVVDERANLSTLDSAAPRSVRAHNEAQGHRINARIRYVEANLAEVVAEWRSQDREPSGPLELAMVGEAWAETASAEALDAAERLRAFEPVEADAIVARLLYRQGKLEESVRALEACFEGARRDPWGANVIMYRALQQANVTAAMDPSLAPRLLRAVLVPFALREQEIYRLESVFEIGSRLDARAHCAQVLGQLEPWVPWDDKHLGYRKDCYAMLGDGRAALAARELEQFRRAEPVKFSLGLVKP